MRVRVLFASTTMVAACVLASACADHAAMTSPTVSAAVGTHTAKQVLLLSIDGLHEVDLANFVASHPSSALARLTQRGTTYRHGGSSKPSDSFPGLLAMVTGGSPAVTGVYYDDSYDRRLSPPGSGCATMGTEVVYDESIDINPDALDAGGGIDPTKLPLDKSRGCTPVYPHSFLRVNTVFEVIHSHGLRTAWSDKHPAYDLVRGPSGTGVTDLFSPEIAANGSIATSDATHAEAYDDVKVRAILNEIDGKDHGGTQTVGVPAILGMNFQAVSVGQKTAGYTDAAGNPTPALADALAHTDASIGKMVLELQQQGLLDNTLIIVTAKHGQSPIDPAQRRIVDKKLVPDAVNSVQSGLVAQATEDDIALLWLTDQSKTRAAVSALMANRSAAAIQYVLAGAPLAAVFGDPRQDSRTPDIIVQPNVGVIYTKLTATKLAEHGGFSSPDTRVPIVLAGPGIRHYVIDDEVSTRQIAPTILTSLGLNPFSLDAVQLEGTRVLPFAFPSNASSVAQAK